MKFKINLGDVFQVLIIIWFLFYGFKSYFFLPVVYWSTSSDKCVKIIYNNYETDCSELPEKYERVWVK